MRLQSIFSPRDRELCGNLLRKHFLLRDADIAVIEQLIPLATVASYASAEEIFTRGDAGSGLYGILSGRVRIYTPGPDTHEVTLNILEPGEIFGEIALIDGEPRSASAVAIGETRLMHIRRDRFLPLLQANADIGIGLLQILCRRVRWSSSLAEDQALLPLSARLAKRLLAIAETAGEATQTGIRLRTRLSQRELGELVGATREAVNRIFAGWLKEGLIASDGGRLTLRNRDALGAIARLD
jgi:CRP/FNR family transcriptional regulator, cyclic AMP receptor protein